jgi:hypothetical protein
VSEGAGTGEEPTLFQALCLGLAAQVEVALGRMPDPTDGQTKPVNLKAARQGVDLLATLEEKTRGNLGPDEERLLGSLLAELRLAYVRNAK